MSGPTGAGPDDSVPDTHGLANLVAGWDRLVGCRPRVSARLPVFVCTGPGADDLVRTYATRLTGDAGDAGDAGDIVPHVHLVGDARVADPQDRAPNTAGEDQATDEPGAGNEGAPRAPGGRDRFLLDEIADGLSRTMPPGTGRLRLPFYRALRHALDVEVPPTNLDEQRHVLGDALYERMRARGPLARHPADDGGETLIHWLRAVLVSVVEWFGRRLYGRHLGRRRRFRSLAAAVQPVVGRHQDFLDMALTLTRDGLNRHDDERVRHVLVLALLHDLDAATPPTRWSPRRRRRNRRFTILLTGAAPGTAAWRFLDALGKVATTRRHDPTMVLAACATPDAVAASLGPVTATDLPGDGPGARRGRRTPLAAAADAVDGLSAERGQDHRKTPDAMIIEVLTWPPDAHSHSWLDRHPQVAPCRPRWALAVPVATYGLLTGLALTGGLAVYLLLDEDGPCPGIERPDGSTERIGLSDGTADCSFVDPDVPPPPSPDAGLEAQLRAAEETIAEQNQAVLDSTSAGNYVDLVFLAPLTVREGTETEGHTSLRAVRGVALAQQEANNLAASSGGLLPVRILLANAGDGFAHGADVARDIADHAEEDERLVGVAGISESRDASVEAIAILEGAGLPVVASTVTGNHMSNTSDRYYQVAPNNRRVAEMMTTFTTHAAGIEGSTRGDHRDAVIVMDDTDLYSQDLAGSIRDELSPGDEHDVTMLSYSPDGDRDGDGLPPTGGDAPTVVSSLEELAADTCAVIEGSEDTVVFYTSRSQQLTGFLNGLDAEPGCDDETIPIVGGDALTRVDDTVDLGDYDFVDLYYAAFAARDTSAQDLVEVYAREYDASDLAVHASDLALSYDAVRALYEAVGAAYSPGESLPSRDEVDTMLRSGSVAFDGESGYVTFGGEQGDRVDDVVPPDKQVLIVGAGATEHDEPLLVCGGLSVNDTRTTWGQGDFPCGDRDAGS